MEWLKLKIWLLRYSLEFRRVTKWSFRESWKYGEATIENYLGDLEDMDCPIEMVQEDLSVWSD